MLGSELESSVTPRDHHVERLVTRRQRDGGVQAGGRALALVPATPETGRAVRIVTDVELQMPAGEAQGHSGGDVGKADPPPQGRHNPTTTGSARGEVGPPHVGKPDVVDVRIHARDDQVPGQDGPVVPALGPSRAAAEVCPVQGVPRPAAGRRIEGPSVASSQIDRLRQLPFHRTFHVCDIPPGRTGFTMARLHLGCHPGQSLGAPPRLGFTTDPPPRRDPGPAGKDAG